MAAAPSTPAQASGAVQSSKLRKMLEEEGLEESYTPDAGGLRFEAVGIAPSGPEPTGAAAAAARAPTKAQSDNPLFFSDLREFVTRPAPGSNPIWKRRKRNEDPRTERRKKRKEKITG